MIKISHDITLPRTVRPQFPKRCVFSGEESPDSKVRVTTFGGGLLSLFSLIFVGSYAVDVPIMEKHKPAFILRGLFDLALLVLVVYLAVSFVWPYAKDLEYARRIAALAMVFVVLLPYMVLVQLWAPPFGMTLSGNNVSYEFRNRQCAIEFLQLNCDHVVEHSIRDK